MFYSMRNVMINVHWPLGKTVHKMLNKHFSNEFLSIQIKRVVIHLELLKNNTDRVQLAVTVFSYSIF